MATGSSRSTPNPAFERTAPAWHIGSLRQRRAAGSAAQHERWASEQAMVGRVSLVAAAESEPARRPCRYAASGAKCLRQLSKVESGSAPEGAARGLTPGRRSGPIHARRFGRPRCWLGRLQVNWSAPSPEGVGEGKRCPVRGRRRRRGGGRLRSLGATPNKFVCARAFAGCVSRYTDRPTLSWRRTVPA